MTASQEDVNTYSTRRGRKQGVMYEAPARPKQTNTERVTQAYACAIRSQPPKPASLREARFAPRVVMLGCGFSCARVRLFDDFLID